MAIDYIEVPTFYYVDDVRFNTEVEAIEYKEILQSLKDDPTLLDIFNIVGTDKELIEIATNELLTVNQ